MPTVKWDIYISLYAGSVSYTERAPASHLSSTIAGRPPGTGRPGASTRNRPLDHDGPQLLHLRRVPVAARDPRRRRSADRPRLRHCSGEPSLARSGGPCRWSSPPPHGCGLQGQERAPDAGAPPQRSCRSRHPIGEWQLRSEDRTLSGKPRVSLMNRTFTRAGSYPHSSDCPAQFPPRH
jgi:hypothetical protein